MQAKTNCASKNKEVTKRIRMQPAKRRTLILQAAEISFAERGFHATTMNDVAAESKISVGALYRYFPSKNALITAIIDRSYQSALAYFAEGDATRTLSLALASIFGDLVSDPPGRRERALIAEVIAESFRNSSVDQALTANELEMEGWLTAQLVDAKADGQLNAELDPASIALVLTALYDGLTLRASPGTEEQMTRVSKLVRKMIAVIFSTP
jgi:TetR/AcrR family transcriptional regulator, repressor for uid operon